MVIYLYRMNVHCQLVSLHTNTNKHMQASAQRESRNKGHGNSFTVVNGLGSSGSDGNILPRCWTPGKGRLTEETQSKYSSSYQGKESCDRWGKELMCAGGGAV